MIFGIEKWNLCIVGNSPCVFDQKHGEFIDSCDRVIRINDFEIEGYEEHVGSRVDIITYAFKTAPKNAVLAKQAKEIWFSRPMDAQRASEARRCLGYVPPVQPSQRLWGELVAFLGDFWRPQPSSGMATIGMALEMYPDDDIYLVGFDDEKFKKHYFDPVFYDDDSTGPVGHDWEAEYKWIQEQERVKIL